jgi:DNA-binding ferritin-like protein
MIKGLIDDNYSVLQRQREAYEICETNKDYPTSNILEELMNETERRYGVAAFHLADARIWFLKMTSEGGANQN